MFGCWKFNLDLESPVVGIDDLGNGLNGQVKFPAGDRNGDMNLVSLLDTGNIDFRKIDADCESGQLDDMNSSHSGAGHLPFLDKNYINSSV